MRKLTKEEKKILFDQLKKKDLTPGEHTVYVGSRPVTVRVDADAATVVSSGKRMPIPEEYQL